MSLRKEQESFAFDVSSLIEYIFAQGYSCTLGEAFRTPEQAKLYASQGKGIVDSLHCQRLAIDLNIFSPNGQYLSDSKDYEIFGIFWESKSSLNRWGGKFKRSDGNHFQRDRSK